MTPSHPGRFSGRRSVRTHLLSLIGAFLIVGIIPDGGLVSGRTGGNAWGEELWVARAQAVRAAVQQVADSVLTVELVGVSEPVSGELAADAPTVAVAIDDQRHFLASTLVTRGNPTSILLVTPAGRRVVAKVVAQDHSRQVVLLRAEEPVIGADAEIPPVKLWDGEAVVGQTVIAVGRHPGSQTAAVSTGILSGAERNWGLALQTDARVSSAFYGGPLIDLYGRVLGIIVPMVPDGGAEDETSWYDSGIAFAIPSRSLSARLPRLVLGEDIRRGLIGIVAKESDPYVESTEIAAVRARSPAARADLQAGDQLVSIDDVEVRSHREIKQLLGGRDAGESVRLGILRDKQSLEQELVLTETIPPLVPQRIGITVRRQTVPADETTEATTPDEGDEAKEAEAGKEGEVVDATEWVVSGLIPGSPADGKVQVGDRLQKLDGNPIDDIESLRRQVFAADPDQPLALSVVREGEQLDIELTSVPIAAIDPQALPSSLDHISGPDEKWEIREFTVPDLANAARLIGPSRPEGVPRASEEVEGRLGLMVLLADPGETDLQKLATPWLEVAQAQGTIICLVAPTAEDRWTPEEIDVPRRLAAAIRQSHDIDPVRQVIGGAGKGPGGALALAAAILRPGTFQGLSVRGDIRPPGGVRLRENDPAAPLQLWVVPGDDGEPPRWGETLQKLGYPVLIGTPEPAALLSWGRSLATI